MCVRERERESARKREGEREREGRRKREREKEREREGERECVSGERVLSALFISCNALNPNFTYMCVRVCVCV